MDLVDLLDVVDLLDLIVKLRVQTMSRSTPEDYEV